MSNNNKFWGKRFGSYDRRPGDPKRSNEPFGNKFTVKQMDYGRSNSGDHQSPVDPKSARGLQSTADKKKFELTGRPIKVVKG